MKEKNLDIRAKAELSRAQLDVDFEPLVRDLMSAEPFSVSENDSLKTLKDIFKQRAIRHLPVADMSGKLVGLVTHRDFLALSISKLADISKEESDEIYEKIKIHQVMGTNFMTMGPDTPARVAAEKLLTHKYGCLLVVEHEKLVGIITETDFVKAFLKWDYQFISGNA
ncbi:CBS domain-containing protein [Bdellovibrionota bacterium FG-2]